MTDLGFQWSALNAAEREACRHIAYDSLIGFTRVMFRFVLGIKFQTNFHHQIVAEELENVYYGRLKRLILNLAPGGTKTELVCIHFPAWTILREYEDAREAKRQTGLASPRSTRILPTSYSDRLVTVNTGRIKEILESEPFQYMCPVRPAGKSRKGEGDWRMRDAQGGTHEAYGVSVTGQLTGNRAGFMTPGYSGVLVIDDPMPPKDLGSFAKKDTINNNLNKVVRSRLNHSDVPIVMVQQRVSTGDQTDFLTSDKALDDYRVVKIPALITPEYAKTLEPRWRALMVADTGFNGHDPVSYWESQVKTEDLLRMRENDPFLFSSQYQQAPDEAMLEGVIFRKEIEDAIKGERIGSVRIDPALPVQSYWDLGYNDMMTMWLAQHTRYGRRVIGCYGNSQLGMEHYLQWMIDYREKFGIRFGKHYGPHDLANHDLMTGVSRIDTALKMGIKFDLVERPARKRDPIEATRRIWPLIEIDETLCSMDPVNPNEKQQDRWGLAALKKYRRKYDGENEVFTNEPVHDWTSHWADSFMLMGLTYKEPRVQELQQPGPSGGSAWSI